MELYCVICITDRKKSEDVIKICGELGLPLTLTNLGKGTATSEHLSLYNLEEAEKAIVSTVADAESMRGLIRLAKKKMYIDIPGNGIIMAIPMKSVGGAKTLAYLTHGKMPTGGKPNLEFENELIIVILNEGYSDTVMDAARSAGATGGTVLHAKGTMKAQSEKFFGVSLADEKDMIYIVSSGEKKSAIMSAISKAAGTDTKCGAFCFSLPIAEVAGIRKFDE